jgi:hypothetical protein
MWGRCFLLVGALVFVTGCGGHRERASHSVSPALSGSSAPGRATVTPVLPSAADGERLSACRDGRCEVLVRAKDKISPPGRLGVPRLTVTSVGSDGVAYLGTGAGITLTFSGQRPGMTSYMNRLAITTVAIVGRQAVVRLAPK